MLVKPYAMSVCDLPVIVTTASRRSCRARAAEAAADRPRRRRSSRRARAAARSCARAGSTSPTIDQRQERRAERPRETRRRSSRREPVDRLDSALRAAAVRMLGSVEQLEQRFGRRERPGCPRPDGAPLSVSARRLLDLLLRKDRVPQRCRARSRAPSSKSSARQVHDSVNRVAGGRDASATPRSSSASAMASAERCGGAAIEHAAGQVRDAVQRQPDRTRCPHGTSR